MVGSAEEVLYFLKKAHDQAVELADKITFDREHALHRTLIALYSSIIELSGTCCSLIDNKQGSAIPIITRAILEAYVDLKNLIDAANYGYYLELSYINEWLVVLHEAKEGKNQYLSQIHQAPNLQESIKRLIAKKEQLNKEGYRKIPIEEKFRRVGMDNEYRAIYSALCAHSHNNMRALIDRHFEFENGDLSLVLYRDYALEEHLVYIGTVSELLIRATEGIHAKFDSSAQDEVQKLRAELDVLRGENG